MANYTNVTFVKPVVINAPGKEVVFNGCDFSEDAHIELVIADSVSFLNCRFYKMNPYQAKSYLILGRACETKLTIEGCFFGGNNKTDAGWTIYNLMELNTVLKDGSSISNNYFAKDCCTHNQINIYAAADGAEIDLNNNFFIESKNGYRFGVKEEPHCTFYIDGNTYITTDDDVDWAGLIIIQPYTTKTTSFNNMTLKITNTKNKTGIEQLIYLFANSSDTHYHVTKNYPVVFVDGERLTDIHLAHTTVLETE